MTPSQTAFAFQVASFINHLIHSDLTKVGMDEVIDGFMKAQESMYAEVSADVKSALS